MSGTVEKEHLIQIHARVWTAAHLLNWTSNRHGLPNPGLDVT